MEIWKQYPIHKKYVISNLGRVWGPRGKVNLRIDKDGYLLASIKGSSNRVHRQVALTFIPNPNGLPDINHIDGNKQNNNVQNLEWVSKKQNIQHAIHVLKVRTKRGHRGRLKINNLKNRIHAISIS